MTPSPDWNLTEQEQKKLNVLARHAQELRRIADQADRVRGQIDGAVGASEALLAKYGMSTRDLAPIPAPSFALLRRVRTWDEVVRDAEANLDSPASFEDLFTFDEMEVAVQNVDLLREEFNASHRLDAIEWSICGAAGSLAALVDVFLISMPTRAGLFGLERSDGGPLANWIRDKVNACLPPEEIRRLEREFKVPYDASISSGLAQPIPGLSPRMHRFQSLGHDPVLCWIFGVKDVLAGTFTAIDKHGRWTVQAANGRDPSERAMGLFEAIAQVFGHLKSDVATFAGLPVPLMPLLQMFQVGRFGKSGHTLGDLSREMYRSGYDFRHFLAMSVAPLLVEALVRLSYFAKRLHDGHAFLDAVPFELPGGERKPKLRTMLFTAHLIATAANAGKVTIGQNPLLINSSQWIAFVRYAIPQLRWVLFEKETERHRFVEAALNREWDEVYRRMNATWSRVFDSPVILG